MDGSGEGRPRRVTAAVVVLVALLAIGVAVAIGLRLGDIGLGDRPATGPVAGDATSSTSRTAPRPRSGSSTTDAASTAVTSTARTTARTVGAVCDARRINADLGYPGSGSRIVDCVGGWAVMASEHSGDPYWVSFRDGRWRNERSISMYLFTCPDEAIARGAPAWMADKHLSNCPALNPVTSDRRPPGTGPSATPPVGTSGVAPSPSESNGVSLSLPPSPSDPPTTSVEMATTTTTVPTPGALAVAGAARQGV
ncbi:hypothetical protein NCCP2495_26880 [Dietzia sp. NCCP-2495]|uniref:hypothetical protein n=1 Tax=Dietzia sp. NCCP-2495 TaxID=2934675 RepID=UPI002231FA43|nr:hypothetical protein [Dietzia sp. NCCP-2495]GLB64808.1 hypothetical protein NCCP2495_26880 [Dietzia sp. NCCP-2495]